MTVRGITLSIDFSGQGTYANAQEDVTSRVDDDADLVVTVGRDSERVTSYAPSSSLSAALLNPDRVLSPDNPSSPIAGKVMSGRKAQLTYQVGPTIYPLLANGVTQPFAVQADGVKNLATTEILDAWGIPGDESLSTPLYTGIRTGDAINLILDAIGWTGLRDIDAGATVMPFWWSENEDAATAVNKIIDSEGPPSIAFVQGGTFVFRDRHHRLFRTRSTTSQFTASYTVPAGSAPTDLKIEDNSFSYDNGLETIVNAVNFSVPMRRAQNPSEVWTSDDPISIAAGEVVTIRAEASDPFYNGVVAVTLQSGVVSVSMSRTSGQAVILTVTGTSAAIVTRLAITANSCPVVRTVEVSAEDASSVGVYTRQLYKGNPPVFANAYDAQAICNRIVAVYSTNEPSVTFSVIARNDTELATLLGALISDRVTVRNDVNGTNGAFIIERIVHTIRGLGKLPHRVTFGAQIADPVQPSNLLTFDVAGKGFNDGLFGTVGIDSATTVMRFDVAGQGFDQGRFGT